QHDHYRAADRAEQALAAPEGTEALANAPAGQREGEQRYRGADGEAQGEPDRAQADVIGGAGHRDGGQDRARAWHEDGAKGDPQDEAVAAGPGDALGEAV